MVVKEPEPRRACEVFRLPTMVGRCVRAEPDDDFADLLGPLLFKIFDTAKSTCN